MGRENALECPHTEVAALLYKLNDQTQENVACVGWEPETMKKFIAIP